MKKIFIIFFLLLSVPVQAQTLPGLSVIDGYSTTPNKNLNFYSIQYLGQMLNQHGSSATDITNQFQVPGNQHLSDANSYNISIEQGATNVSSGLFNAIGLNNVAIPIPVIKNFRESGYVNGIFDGKNFNTALGLESFPIHPLQLVGLNKHHTATDWLLVGAYGERESAAPGAGITQNTALLTFRDLIGKALWWRHSGVDTLNATDILEQATTLQQASQLGYAINNNPSTPVQSYIVAKLANNPNLYNINPGDPRYTDPNYWSTQVLADLPAYNMAYDETPGLVIFTESEGWCTVAGNPQGSRVKALFAAEADFAVAKQTNLIMRYENGFAQAEPTTRINRLIIGVKITL